MVGVRADVRDCVVSAAIPRRHPSMTNSTQPASAGPSLTADERALRYPIGTAPRTEAVSPEDRAANIARIAALPGALRKIVQGLNDDQLDTRYRPGGWSVRQLVHHVADSHMNAFIRVKLALTEDEPTIKPYDQDAWVTLADINAVPPAVSLSIVDGVHARLTAVLRAMKPEEFARKLMHPENGPMTIDRLVGMYAWHGDHHVAHIRGLRARESW